MPKDTGVPQVSDGIGGQETAEGRTDLLSDRVLLRVGSGEV